MSYYKDLNILPIASMDEILTAYNNIINNDTELDDKIKYNKAFTTLSNYNSRRKYDNLMEENSKPITAYNIDNFQSYLSFEDNNSKNNNIEVLNKDTSNDNDISNDENLLNKIESLFLDLNIRLESIEKKIYSNEINNNKFYKERKKINTNWTRGKKVVNIVTDVNNNGDLSRKLKTIGYDSDGNQEVKYKTINNKNLPNDI
jgi:hypothetical protein